MSFMSSNQMKRIFDALVAQMPLANKRHDDGDEQAEEDDNGINMDIEAHQYRVQSQHAENAQVLVEILHRDRMARPHEDVPPVLQERIHRHHEKSRQATDQYQEDKGDPEIARQDHGHDYNAHGDTERNYLYRSRNDTKRAAMTAPIAIPTATTPCSCAALLNG